MVFGVGEMLDDLFRRKADSLRVEQGLERASAEELRDHAVSAHAGGNLLVSILAVGEAEPTNRLFRIDGLHMGIISVGFHPVIAFGGAVKIWISGMLLSGSSFWLGWLTMAA